MKSKLRAALVAAVCALALNLGATLNSYADTIITFNVSATLQTGTLGGTLTLDVTDPAFLFFPPRPSPRPAPEPGLSPHRPNSFQSRRALLASPSPILR